MTAADGVRHPPASRTAHPPGTGTIAIALWLLGGCSATALYLYLGYRADLLSPAPFLAAYGALFVLLFAATRTLPRSWSWKQIIGIALAMRLLFLFSIPPLSQDYHRFLWDGAVTAQGENPYRYTPAQLKEKSSSLALDPQLLETMNSAHFYSVYPPLLQGVYALGATLFPRSYRGALAIMRLLFIAADAGTLLLLASLLQRRGSSLRIVALYAWNPFIVVELCGNLHAEGIMLFFLMLFLWLDARRRPLCASAALGLAIATKLLPLMLLPLVWRRWGTKVFAAGLCLIVALNLAQWLPFAWPGLAGNVALSLQLYFTHFEFNASLYYLLRAAVRATGISSVNPGTVLGVTAGIAILLYSLRTRAALYKPLSFSVLVIWSLYYFCATTVHPWYLTTIVAVGTLAGFRFPLIWSLLLPLTYLTYSRIPFAEPMWIVRLEYLAVGAVVVAESGGAHRVWRTLRLALARRKAALLLPLYKHHETVLDVGTGNGALAKLLQDHAVALCPLDIAPRSLFPSATPVVYDGSRFPFPDARFDTAQFITVLHHCHNVCALVEEGARVAQRIVVLEDTYRGCIQKWVTMAADSLANLEFLGHPHANRCDREWRALFEQHGLTVTHSTTRRFLLFFEQTLYVARKKNENILSVSSR